MKIHYLLMLAATLAATVALTSCNGEAFVKQHMTKYKFVCERSDPEKNVVYYCNNTLTHNPQGAGFWIAECIDDNGEEYDLVETTCLTVKGYVNNKAAK